MWMKKLTALGLALVVFGWIALQPARAEALSGWAWAGIGLASYIALLVVATTIAFPNPAPLAPGAWELPEKEGDKDAIEFGGGCRQQGSGLVVACW